MPPLRYRCAADHAAVILHPASSSFPLDALQKGLTLCFQSAGIGFDAVHGKDFGLSADDALGFIQQGSDGCDDLQV